MNLTWSDVLYLLNEKRQSENLQPIKYFNFIYHLNRFNFKSSGSLNQEKERENTTTLSSQNWIDCDIVQSNSYIKALSNDYLKLSKVDVLKIIEKNLVMDFVVHCLGEKPPEFKRANIWNDWESEILFHLDELKNMKT